MVRRRLHYGLLAAGTIFLGLASRKLSFLLPWWMAKNAGDVLYAVMVFWLIGFALPRLPTPSAALSAFLFCAMIECLKFSQVDWLVAARHSAAGALVFGTGFHASNLVCYGIGVALAACLERLMGVIVCKRPL